MFSKKVVTVIELSDESKQALAAIDNDIQVLVSLMQEVISNQRSVIQSLSGEIAKQVPVSVADDLVDEATAGNEMDAETKQSLRNYEQQRESPFARRPRHEQVEWLLRIMKDGRWHSPILIARSTALDEAHFRYLRRAIQGRMREMHEEGLLDRRQSQVAGAMFDYKLKKS